MNDNFADFPNRFLLHEVVGRAIAAVPRSFVIHENLDLSVPRGLLHRARIVETHGQRLLHHHVNGVARADFHGFAMVGGIGVNKHGLGMHAREHFFEVREE